jgi:hypothetical protein
MTYKYERNGYLEQGRPVDEIISTVTEMLPGPELPARWSYKDKESFLSTHGDSDQILWSRTKSYHLLMVHGDHTARFWTDSPKSCIVDVHDMIAKLVRLPVEKAPASVYRKTKPFTQRVTISTVSEALLIVKTVKVLWGI